MWVRVRLFAGLRQKLPDAERGRADLELPSGASVQDLLDGLEIPRVQAQVTLVNGVVISRDPGRREAHRLQDGDDVAVFPPVAGG